MSRRPDATRCVLVASYLEPEHVARLRAAAPGLEVIYEPALVPPPRYAADHTGGPFARSANDETRWRRYLSRADILFDFDQTHRQDLPDLAPRVRWIQATSAGIGQFVKRMDYAARMPHTTFTTASGVHAQPLAEFAVMGMLAFSRGLLRMVADQRRKHWERFAGTDLAGRTVVIVGAGAVGTSVARLARALGMRTVGIKRDAAGADPAALHLDQVLAPAGLRDALRRAEYLVLCAPHTPETERMIGREQLESLPAGAVIVNVGRGAVIDEPALVDALRSGHLGGACLDVFAEEPLPTTSPLWDLPNVLVSPHSGSTSDRENARLTDLFCQNLERYLEGKPLLNVLDTSRLY